MSTIFLFETFIYIVFALPAAVLSVRKFKIPFVYLCFGTFALLIYRLFYFMPDSNSFLILLRHSSAMDFIRNFVFIISGMGSTFFIFIVLRFFSDGEIKMDDVFFAVFTSLYCQFYHNLIAIICSACAGVLYYLFLAAVQKFKRNKIIIRPLFALHFVPFIAFGAVIARALL